MVNQVQIKHLRYSALSTIKAVTARQATLSYCDEQDTIYVYEESGGSYTANDEDVLITGAGGNTRWLGIAGKYVNATYGHAASGISYDNTTHGLDANNVQDAIDQNTLLDFFNYRGFVDPSEFTLSLTGTYTDVVKLKRTSTNGIRYVRSGKIIKILSGGILGDVLGTDYVKIVVDGGTEGNYHMEGLHYIYINSSDGTLSSSQTPWAFTNAICPLTIAWWDNSRASGNEGRLAYEAHTTRFPYQLHSLLHYTQGTKKKYGAALSGYTPNSFNDSHTKFDISEAEINDEDISIVVSQFAKATDTAEIAYYYPTGSIWRYTPNSSGFPFKTTSSVISYNNAGVLAAITNNYYVCYYLAVTNFQGTARFIWFVGESETNSLATAQTQTPITDLSLTAFPFPELIFVSKVIWQYKSAQTNTGKCCIISVNDISINYSIISGGLTSSVHNSLTGRSDSACHPATAISYTVGTNDKLSSITVGGAIYELAPKINVITSDTTLDGTYGILLCNSSSPITISIPSALNSSLVGRQFTIKNIGSSIVIVETLDVLDGLIEGSNNVILSHKYDYVTIAANNSGTSSALTGWFIISSNI